MISSDGVMAVHELLILKYGGSSGLRDETLLQSALARPYSTFSGQELYPTSIEKAAAILESLLINHPFVDGNKRTAYTLMRLILLDSGRDVACNVSTTIAATQTEKYNLVIDSSKRALRNPDIVEWLEIHAAVVA